MKKYIVVDTWNGEGYSYNNGVDTKQFQYKKSAFKHAYKRVLSNTNGDADLVCRYSDEEMNHSLWEAVKRDADGKITDKKKYRTPQNNPSGVGEAVLKPLDEKDRDRLKYLEKKFGDG